MNDDDYIKSILIFAVIMFVIGAIIIGYSNKKAYIASLPHKCYSKGVLVYTGSLINLDKMRVYSCSTPSYFTIGDKMIPIDMKKQCILVDENI